MRVQMLTKIGGYRNEVEWPEKGGFIVVPDHEGRDLIVAGYAKEAERAADEDQPAAADGDSEAVDGPADEAAADGDSEAGADGNPADAVTEPEKPEPAASSKRRGK